MRHVSTACVLWVLATYADEDGACYPSVRCIAADACLHPDTVRSAVRELVRLGLVTRGQRWRHDGGETSSLYRLSLTRNFEDTLNVSPPMADGHRG